MDSDLDLVIGRQTSDSIKWHYYDPDVLPLWVADMDFRSPEPVLRALSERVAHGVFGYPQEPPELRSTIVERLWRLYGWQVAEEALVFLPGVVVGFNLAIRAVTSPGDGVLAQTPVYFPILWAPPNSGCTLQEMELTRNTDGSYCIDFDAMQATISPQTRIFVLCSPHNPVGRVWRREELERMAEICLRRDVIICSDEIHCDLVFSGSQHLPIASLDPDIARRCITLMAPSKTFNVAGLACSFAIVQDEELRRRFTAAHAGLIPGHLDVMSYTAALAAYREGQPWLDNILRYLEANRDALEAYTREHLPGLRVWSPEGTYLAWIDCTGAGIPGSPHTFFKEKARVALNEGAMFGRGGEGFVRLNFGCPRSTLQKALERMRCALEARP